MYKFILIGSSSKEENVEVISEGTFRSEEAMLDDWCQQLSGWVPDHTENIESDLPEDTHPDRVLAYSKDRTCQRFGIGCERSEEFSSDWLLIRVDLRTADTVTYPFEGYVPEGHTIPHPDWTCPACGNNRNFEMKFDGDFETIRTYEGPDQHDDTDFTTKQVEYVMCNKCSKKGGTETFAREE